MRTRWMRRSNRKTAPAVDDRSGFAKSDCLDDLIFHCGIAVDRLMNRCMQSDDFVNTTHVVTEPVNERSVFAEERRKCRHLVTIPCFLEFLRYLFRSSHPDYLNPRPWNAWLGFDLNDRSLTSLKSQSGSRQSEPALRKEESVLPHLLRKRLSM